MNTKLSLLIALFSLTIFIQQGAAQQKSIYDSIDTEKNNQRNFLRKNGNSKIALVIGNNNYEYGGRLREPVNDANIISEALTSRGFDVILGFNLDDEELKNIVYDFADQLSNYGIAIVFYAGHGFQVDGENYLIPINVNLSRKAQVKRHCLNVKDILAEIDKPEISKLILMDACRNNPFERSWNGEERLTLQRGMTSITALDNSMILFSTAEGTTVSDDNQFAEILSRKINQGGCLQGNIISHVIREVKKENPQQLIRPSGWLEDDICFGESSSKTPSSSKTVPANRPKPPELPDTVLSITEGAKRMSMGEYNALTIDLIANKQEVHNLWTKYTYKKIGGKPIYNGRKKELFVKRIRNTEMSSHPMNLYSKIEAHGASTLLTVWVDLGKDEFLHSQKHPHEYEVVRKWLLDFAEEVTR